MTKTGRKLHRDTEEVHLNTPRLKPTCIFSPPSQRQWQEGGGEEEAEPTFKWRKEGRKEGLRKEDAKAVFSHHPRPWSSKNRWGVSSHYTHKNTTSVMAGNKKLWPAGKAKRQI